MPTVLFIRGWRLFCYTNERHEPPHVHAQRGDSERKYRLYPETFDIEEVYAYRLGPGERRAIRQIIFDHFDYIVADYAKLHSHGSGSR